MNVRNPLDAMPGLEHPVAQLMLSILLDAMGMLTYLVPFLGEFGDIVYAPIQTLYVASMAGWERLGWAFVVLSFVEEILPFTDFVPSCTIAWIWKYVRR